MLDTVAVTDFVLHRLRILPRTEVLDGKVKQTPAAPTSSPTTTPRSCPAAPLPAWPTEPGSSGQCASADLAS